MLLFKEHRLRGTTKKALKRYTHTHAPPKKKKIEVLKLFLFGKVQNRARFLFLWEALKKKKCIPSKPSLKHS